MFPCNYHFGSKTGRHVSQPEFVQPGPSTASQPAPEPEETDFLGRSRDEVKASLRAGYANPGNPLTLSVLLHYHRGETQPCLIWFGLSAYTAAHDHLVRRGLLAKSTQRKLFIPAHLHEALKTATYNITDRGRAHVEQLVSIPYPRGRLGSGVYLQGIAANHAAHYEPIPLPVGYTPRVGPNLTDAEIAQRVAARRAVELVTLYVWYNIARDIYERSSCRVDPKYRFVEAKVTRDVIHSLWGPSQQAGVQDKLRELYAANLRNLCWAPRGK